MMCPYYACVWTRFFSSLVPVGDTIRDKVHAARHNVDTPFFPPFFFPPVLPSSSSRQLFTIYICRVLNGFELFIQIQTLFMFKVFLNSKLIFKKYKLIHF